MTSSSSSNPARRASRLRALAYAQGVFYVVAGVWPLVHYRSFTAVTGPKVDDWLVKTVGLLIASIGTALVAGARKDELSSVSTLGASGAGSLCAISLYYASKKRISPVYLLDAAVEGAIFTAWVGLTGGDVTSSRLLATRHDTTAQSRSIQTTQLP